MPLRRLHPLTPLVRGWKILAGMLAVGTSQIADLVSIGEGRSPATTIAVVLGAFAVIALLAVLAGWLSWRHTRYGIEAGDLRIDTGMLMRQSRRVRLDRLQAVDVVRPLLARALGLAELRLEVAGGSSAEAPLAYLSEDDAHALRAELLARAAGLTSDTPEAPERGLHTVSAPRLLASSLLQLPVLIGVVIGAALAISAIAAGEAGALMFLVPAVFSSAPSFGKQFVANYGFTLADSPDGLRIRRGLLETRAQTVPPGRVQAVRMTQPLLWRMFTGWARLEVEIAGYSGRGAAAAEAAVLLPVASRGDCVALLEAVLGGAEVAAITTEAAPRRARWLAPLSRRVLTAGADERYFVATRGALRRTTDVMPHERVQSVRAHQHPLQRLLGLASVTLDTTPGPITVTALHRDAAAAWELAQQQAIRARAARARAVPEEWMLGGYITGGEGGTPGGATAGGAIGGGAEAGPADG